MISQYYPKDFLKVITTFQEVIYESQMIMKWSSIEEGRRAKAEIITVRKSYKRNSLQVDFMGGEAVGRKMFSMIRIQESFYCMRCKDGSRGSQDYLFGSLDWKGVGEWLWGKQGVGGSSDEVQLLAKIPHGQWWSPCFSVSYLKGIPFLLKYKNGKGKLIIGCPKAGLFIKLSSKALKAKS